MPYVVWRENGKVSVTNVRRKYTCTGVTGPFWAAKDLASCDCHCFFSTYILTNPLHWKTFHIRKKCKAVQYHFSMMHSYQNLSASHWLGHMQLNACVCGLGMKIDNHAKYDNSQIRAVSKNNFLDIHAREQRVEGAKKLVMTHSSY